MIERLKVVEAVVELCGKVRAQRYFVHRGDANLALFDAHRKHIAFVVVQDSSLRGADPRLMTDAVIEFTDFLVMLVRTLPGTPEELADGYLAETHDDAMWVLRELAGTLLRTTSPRRGASAPPIAIEFPGARARDVAGADFGLQGVAATFRVTH